MGKKLSIERELSDIGRLLENKDFKSMKEANAFLEKLLGKGNIPKTNSPSASQKAQDLIYDAWDEDDPDERIRLAKKALKIYPHCVDAYNVLAQETASSLEDEARLYEKGVKAGERALGKKMFQENEGHFWGVFETRPYMRARAGLAECLWELGKYEESIKHHEALLRLNTNDNQGIRYILVAHYGVVEKFKELNDLLSCEEYYDDFSPHWLWTRVLLLFKDEGDSDKAKKQFLIAMEENHFVPDYLTGKKAIKEELPDRVTVGGEDEAMCYVSDLLALWLKVPGAIEWVREKMLLNMGYQNIWRNDPCPCGSGKKYKKCCGTIKGNA